MEDPCTQDRFSAPERTPGPPAPPRARTVPRRDRDRANVPDRAANVELLTLRARRCVAPRARRAEKREQKKRDRLFEKQNTRVCSGYWCPYTGRRESNDRFRGGGGCLRRRGGRRAGARARRRGGSRSRSRACASGEGPMGGKARERAKCGVRHARKGRPVDVESQPPKPWVERSLAAPASGRRRRYWYTFELSRGEKQASPSGGRESIYHEALGRSLVHTKVPSGDLVQMPPRP